MSLADALVRSFKNIEDLVRELKEGRGGIKMYLRDALGITPEVAHFDVIDMPGTITTSTNITQPSTVRIHSDMDFVAFGMGAYISSPSDTPANFALITFNIKESGRNFDVFTSDVNAAPFLTTSGPNAPWTWDQGFYKFRHGSDVKTTIKVASGFAGAAKTFGVYLIGNLIKR